MRSTGTASASNRRRCSWSFHGRPSFISGRVPPASITSGHRVRNTLFNAAGLASPYWAPWAAMPQYQVPGFADLRKRYRNVGGGVGHPQESARARFAVTQEFNEMNSLVKAELIESIWGFLGTCASQPISNRAADPHKVVFLGGDYQLVLPGLRTQDIFKL